MTSEIIVVLISRIKEIRSTNNMTHGNIPRNSDAQEMPISSGFYDYVTTRMSIRTPTYGTIEKCADNIVDSGKAAHLIDKVSELIGMSPEQEDGHQTTAMECMTNTREHASGHQPSQQGNKNWWFSVYCDQEKNLAQFSFVDLRIGIFVSLEKHQIQWLAHDRFCKKI